MSELPRVRTRHADLALEEVASALPGTGEVMASVGRCFAMSRHAWRGGNRDLAAYFVRRTRSLLRGLAVTRPKYAAQLAAYDREHLEPLHVSLLSGDAAAFEERYGAAVEEANRYHAVTGHPYIRWAAPADPPDRALDLRGGA